MFRVRWSARDVKKNPRVADESMFNNNGDLELPMGMPRGRGGGAWSGGLSLVLSVVCAPFTILTCFSGQHVSGGGADGVWVSAGGEFAHISEMNHLMVNDSMRYAILM